MAHNATRYLGGQCSHEDLLQIFGELDLRRAQHRGIHYYVCQVASPKIHHVAFSTAVVRLHGILKAGQFHEARLLVSHLPELLRGALIHWGQTPDFLLQVLEEQRQQGFWPFGEEYLP